jgi:hypothetical protein
MIDNNDESGRKKMYKAIVGLFVTAALSGCCGMGAGGCKPETCGGTAKENCGCDRGCACGKKVTY